MGDLITMSQKELERAKLLEQRAQKRMSQKDIAECLELSTRQVRRLESAYLKDGERGLISKKRNRAGNHRIAVSIKEKALSLIHKKYHDFGPTLAHEKLVETDGLKISLSTVRSLMISHLIWTPRRAKMPTIHQLRERRACFGELIQFDGSMHLWFGDREKQCVALVFIDDATSRLVLVRFVIVENLWDYFDAMRCYIEKYGKPMAVYCDRHSSLRKRKPSLLAERGMTQFQRAMNALDIELIHAHSPQAKGRVERANRTLQDRLIKEMRLRDISSIEAANAFSDEFISDYNKRFAKEPRCQVDAHRTIEEKVNLVEIFSWQEERTVTKNLTIQYGGKHYSLTRCDRCTSLRKGIRVQVIENREGGVKILYDGKEVTYCLYEELPYENSQEEMERYATLGMRWANKKEHYRPGSSHPWKQMSKRYGTVVKA